MSLTEGKANEGKPQAVLPHEIVNRYRKEKTPLFDVVLRQQYHQRRPTKQNLWSLYQILSWLRIPSPAFFVRGAEVVPCPCCGERFKIIGSRRRKVYQRLWGNHHLEHSKTALCSMQEEFIMNYRILLCHTNDMR